MPDAEALIALRGLAGSSRTNAPGLSTLPGNFQAKKRGQGQETADIRAYVLGDDVRAVDRNVTARTGNLHVRIHQADRDRTILLVADFRPSMLWGIKRAFRSVAAAEALSLVGWRAIDEGARVGLLAITNAGHEAVPARSRPRAMLAAIGGMVRAHEVAFEAARSDLTDSGLDEALQQVLRIMDRNTEVVVASGFDTPGPNFALKCKEIEDRGVLRRIEVSDGVGSALPRGRYRMTTPAGRAMQARVEEPDGSPTALGVVDPTRPPSQTVRVLEAVF